MARNDGLESRCVRYDEGSKHDLRFRIQAEANISCIGLTGCTKRRVNVVGLHHHRYPACLSSILSQN